MAKVQAKVYVEEDIWNAAQAVWDEQGMSNSVGLERVLKTLNEANHATRLLLLRQAGGGDFGRQLAQSILNAEVKPSMKMVATDAPRPVKDAARTNPDAKGGGGRRARD